ncbi:hypothetical protein GGD61_002215 [Bradyrhizobium sp. SBR1B]|nr:hypothetical protein [Bradyrhizobium sp. SBR1B]
MLLSQFTNEGNWLRRRSRGKAQLSWRRLSAGREGKLGGLGRLVIGSHGVVVRAAGTAGLGARAESFVDDGLDRPGAAAAFGATAEASIDLLGMAHGVVGLGDGGADVVIAQHVTGTNDHGSGRPFVMRHHRYLTGPPDAKGKSGI